MAPMTRMFWLTKGYLLSIRVISEIRGCRHSTNATPACPAL